MTLIWIDLKAFDHPRYCSTVVIRNTQLPGKSILRQNSANLFMWLSSMRTGLTPFGNGEQVHKQSGEKSAFL